jgi:6-pyruvoyltetrahydropterin/6-carboxytetrahydropterin synthase
MRIAIDGWKAHIKFSAAHAIAGHPKCGRLHGHTYAVHLVLHGEAGDDAMVFDFGVAKRALRRLTDKLDHRFIVPAGAATAVGSALEVRLAAKTYRVPRADVALVEVEASSAERLAEYFARSLVLAVDFPPSVHEIEVGVDEGPGQGAWVSLRLPTRAKRERDPKRRVPRKV